eukprot:4739549-Pyramimonas_sp.AAC.1
MGQAWCAPSCRFTRLLHASNRASRRPRNIATAGSAPALARYVRRHRPAQCPPRAFVIAVGASP